MQVSDQISTVSGIGPKLASKFHKLEIYSVGDLLQRFPRRYLDFSKDVSISELNFEFPQAFVATISEFKHIRLRGKGNRSMQTATLVDESGEFIKAMWFNFNFLQDSIKQDNQYAFVGRLSTGKRGEIYIASPDFERLDRDRLHTQGIVPVYSLTNGLSPKQYRRFVKTCLEDVKNLKTMSEIFSHTDTLNTKLNLEQPLIDYTEAISEIHFPTRNEQLEQARFRLAIEELIPIQRQILKQQLARQSISPVVPVISAQNTKRYNSHKFNEIFQQSFQDFWQRSFKFSPTSDQQATARDIHQDFSTNAPALRLIQGDVGTGKTAVAQYATFLSHSAGFSTVIMAPTTVLAEQHYQKFKPLFENTHLITSDTDYGKTPVYQNNPDAQATIKEKPRVLIGTQALLARSENLNLKPGLIIVDEEHRFGVNQRQALLKFGQQKDKLPHYYKLTATPIPRTLALGIFGQISISTLTDKPSQQLPRETMLVPESKRADAYRWIDREIDKGEKVFWVCPLIEEVTQTGNDIGILTTSEKASVEKIKKELSNKLAHRSTQVLHGKLSDQQKLTILEDFKRGKFEILISTSVIEVGIDIPSVNLIIIENADNFGLAQLHQLRGRVGRGEKPGRCLVFTGKETASKRLQYFASENNGLNLAEFDLQSRGPGEVYGKKQSGVPNLQIADISSEIQLQTTLDIVKLEQS